jgi:hypothetical protein
MQRPRFFNPVILFILALWVVGGIAYGIVGVWSFNYDGPIKPLAVWAAIWLADTALLLAILYAAWRLVLFGWARLSR